VLISFLDLLNVKKIGDNNIHAPGSKRLRRVRSRFAAFKIQGSRLPLRGVQGSRFKVQKSLNRQDRQGREERQVFAVLWILCVLERAQRAGGENKQAVLCDLRASNARQRVGGEEL
jgi:hypothetical protein